MERIRISWSNIVKVKNDLIEIKKLVGKVTREDIKYVDYFLSDNLGVFMPLGGACQYAITPMHKHPSYMIVFPFNDETAVKINNKIFEAKQNKIFVLSPEIPHQELPSDLPPRYIAICIKKNFFEKEIKNCNISKKIIFSGNYYDANSELLPNLRKFMIEANSESPGSNSVLNAISVEICHSILRSIYSLKSEIAEKISNRIEIDRVINFLHANIDEKITVEKMAEIAFMSPSHFFKIFKFETALSPMDYLNLIRLKTAKKMLSIECKSITEIALECGFTSSSYLSTCFTQKYKISPLEYRKSLQKSSIPKKNSRKAKD